MKSRQKKILLFNGFPVENMWNGGMFEPYELPSLPNFSSYRNVEEEEFSQIPQLVSSQKIEKKQSVNHEFRRYMLEEVFKPMFQKLRIKNPQQYRNYYHLMAADCVFIFPEHKKYTMVVMMVSDILDKYRIEYFIYIQNTQEIYRWKYLAETIGVSKYEYAKEVISNLSELSGWDDPGFLNSSRTMDDENLGTIMSSKRKMKNIFI